ncbi:MAG: hypothetical protein ABIJ86_01705 [Spirochaetota bacterium]
MEHGNAQDLRARVDMLALEACVILAQTKLSAADVEQARRLGRLEMACPAGAKAHLEVGGVTIAEGVMKRRWGTQVFVLSKAYGNSEEAGK